jgi:hypothetical protein
MPSALSKKVDEINAELATLISSAQSVLTAEAVFTVEEVRALSRPISEMAPILAAAKQPPQDPQIEAQLKRYKAQLRELQPILDRLCTMLVAKRSHLYSGQSQLKAVSNWAAALSTTNEL